MKTEKEIYDALYGIYGEDKYYFNIIKYHPLKDSKIECICKKCGHKKVGTYWFFKRGMYYCRSCESNKKAFKDKDIIKNLQEKYKDFNFSIVDNESNLNKKKIICECKKCKKTFVRTYRHLINRTVVCPICGETTKKHNMRQRVYNEIKNKGLEIIDFNYDNNRSKIKVRCEKCGNIFETCYLVIQQGLSGCKKCQYDKMKYSNAEINEKIKKIYGGTIVLLDEYSGINNKIKVKCTICGNIWETTPYSLIVQKTGCHVCSKYVSYPNKLMKQILLRFKDDVKELEEEKYLTKINKSWHGRHRFDFAIETKDDRKYIIEMDGAISHKNSKIDEIKDEFARKNGYEVIRIDCMYNNYEKRFEYIKNSIINSCLSNLFDLSSLTNDEWEKMNNISVISPYREIFEYYKNNKDKTAKEIGKKFNKSKKTIYKILKILK